MKLAFRRLIAYWLDFIILAVCFCGLQWLLSALASGFPFKLLDAGWKIELWVLCTISLPVWLYFILLEKFRRQTLGKRLLRLEVTDGQGRNISAGQAFLRTFVRLLPWELTHLIILVPTPWWWMQAVPSDFPLIYLPNAIVVLYIVILLINRGKKGLHDYLPGTTVNCAAKK